MQARCALPTPWHPDVQQEKEGEGNTTQRLAQLTRTPVAEVERLLEEAFADKALLPAEVCGWVGGEGWVCGLAGCAVALILG